MIIMYVPLKHKAPPYAVCGTSVMCAVSTFGKSKGVLGYA